MRIAGIIAEYNPFHNGHLFHINSTRAANADGIVCVLGSNFTQRGDVSVLSKQARTICALNGGADLVIELPISYSLAAAADFAFGGVFLLNALGCIDFLSFGSECGNIDILSGCADAIAKNGHKISGHLKSGIGYAAAVHRAVSEDYGETLEKTLKAPNDTLAIEYITAIRHLNSDIIPFPVKREGARHDGTPDKTSAVHKQYASASFIREQIKNIKDIKNFVPESVFSVIQDEFLQGHAPVFLENIDMAVLSRLRGLSLSDLENVPAVSEGLHNRIYSAIRKSRSLNEIIEYSKTKRYTTARIRRICLSAAIGLPKRPYRPEYIRVLGFNKKGEEILKIAKSTACLPLVTLYSQINKLGKNAVKQFSLECAATDLYSLGSKIPQPCGLEMTAGIIKYDNLNRKDK